MEILCKNNIGICFSFKFSSMESIINHSHDRISMVVLLADVQIYRRIEVRWTLCLHLLHIKI